MLRRILNSELKGLHYHASVQEETFCLTFTRPLASKILVAKGKKVPLEALVNHSFKARRGLFWGEWGAIRGLLGVCDSQTKRISNH